MQLGYSDEKEIGEAERAMEVIRMAMNVATEELCTALRQQRYALGEVIADLEAEARRLAYRLEDGTWSGVARWAFDRAVDGVREHLAATIGEFRDAHDATDRALRQLEG